MDLVSVLELSAITITQKKDLEKVLAHVVAAVTKGHDDALLSSAASALQGFAWQSYPLQHMMLPALSILLETLAKNFESASHSFHKVSVVKAVSFPLPFDR